MTQPKLLLDQHNAVYLIPQRLAWGTANPLKRLFLNGETQRLAAYEADVCRRFDYVTWVTEEDRRAIVALPQAQAAGLAPSTVIPICADPESVAPVRRDPAKRRVTFLGGLHWPPNAEGVRWFAQHVFPEVRAAVPDAVLTVIGRDPPAVLTGEGIETTGHVVDPLPYLAQTAAFIVPLHAGGGMRVKILNAWSWGLPVVSTTIGAEGIEIQPQRDILIADSAGAFAQAAIRLLQNPALSQHLAEGGRQTVLQKYNWRTGYAAWDEVYDRLGGV